MEAFKRDVPPHLSRRAASAHSNGNSTSAPGQPAEAFGNGHEAVSLRRWRIALYSNDAMGLGHVRRNLLIAQALAASLVEPAILMMAGTRQATAFAMPPGVDCLTFPALRRDGDGQYQARCLNIPLRDLIDLRAKIICATLEMFEPEVLIVGNLPLGAARELEPALASLRARGGTRCVLGLRDVLDEPARVRRAWAKLANEQAIGDYYDAVWVYGDPAVYDPVREYRFSREVADKVRYTGYLDQRLRLQLAPPPDPAGGAGEDPGEGDGPDPVAALLSQPGRLALCLVGGGQDGAALAEAFAQVALPPETLGVLLTGPFMPPEAQQRLRRRLAGDRRFRVLEFLREPTRLLTRADRVIAMGGYNTVCEVLSLEKRALIVPRVSPDQEQWIRALRLRELGLLDVLHPDDLTPRALTEWLACELGPPPRVRERLDFDGLTRLPRLLSELLAGSATGGGKIDTLARCSRNGDPSPAACWSCARSD